MVKDIWPGKASSGLGQLQEFDGVAYFFANNGINGMELWKSDGTEAGTVMVYTRSNLKILYPTSVGNILYFTFTDQSGNTSELWKSDGTTAGTMLLKTATAFENLTDVNGTLFFTASENAVPYYRLWKSNGTAAGTVSAIGCMHGAPFCYSALLFAAAVWTLRRRL